MTKKTGIWQMGGWQQTMLYNIGRTIQTNILNDMADQGIANAIIWERQEIDFKIYEGRAA